MRASASRWFYYKALLWNLKYCCEQIENLSYWLTAEQLHFIGFSITVSKPDTQLNLGC